MPKIYIYRCIQLEYTREGHPCIHTKFDSTPRREDCGSVQTTRSSKSLLHKSKVYLRRADDIDSDGRNLDQAILASGNKAFASDASYFLRTAAGTLSDDQVREEIDPTTSDLYPFMIAASGLK